MSRWYVNNTGRISGTFVDSTGTATNATAVSITIYDTSDESVELVATDILANTTGTGVYYYDWTPTAAGNYRAEMTATVQSKQEFVPKEIKVYRASEVRSE